MTSDMFSSAYPDIKLNYPSVSPCLSEDTNEYLINFNRLHKVLLEVLEKLGSIYSTVSSDLISLIDTSNKKILEVTKGAIHPTTSSLSSFLAMCLSEVEKQATSLRCFETSLQSTVVKPLRHIVRQKKETWKSCFRYADSFTQQIGKHDAALQKCYKEYSEAAVRVKPGNAMERQFQIFHDLHNTYVLKWTSVNSVHNVFHTHVLPHIMHVIEKNHEELSNNYRHHLSNMLYLHNSTWGKIVASGGEMQTGLANLDFLQDLQRFIKSSNEKSKDIPTYLPSFSLPKVEQQKSGILNNLDSMFVINDRTRPNLQRRLASLQQQTQKLVDEISTLREEEQKQGLQADKTPSLSNLLSFLNICDKEANLNVLLKQMELYTPAVINFLGPMPDNLLLESKRWKKSAEEATTAPMFNENSRPHEFTEPRVMKPISCFYCEKLIAIIGRGYICKTCKISVHKKCATSVKFCEPLLLAHNKIPTAPPESVAGSPSSVRDTRPTAFVSDLIFLESDEEFEDIHGEFDDGFSEESDHECSTKEVSGLYPSLLDSLAAHQGEENTRSTNNVSNVLPDILNFGSVPLHGTAQQTIPSSPIAPTSGYPSLDEKYSDLILINPMSSENTSALNVPTLPPRPVSKPVVARKRLNSTPVFGMSNTSRNNDATKTSGTNTFNDSNNKESNLFTDNLISLDPVYDEIEKTKDLPQIPPRPCKPFVAKKPVAAQSQNAAKEQTHKTILASSVLAKDALLAPEEDGVHSPSECLRGITQFSEDFESFPLQNTSMSIFDQTPFSEADQMFCVSLYEFKGTDQSYVSFSAGEKVKLIEKSNEDWWLGEIGMQSGYFPSQYVLEMRDRDQRIGKAMYDFSSEHVVELSVMEGDVVLVLEEKDDWLKIKSKDGEGLVPLSYVELI